MTAAHVTRVTVLTEHADGTITRYTCDQPASCSVVTGSAGTWPGPQPYSGWMLSPALAGLVTVSFEIWPGSGGFTTETGAGPAGPGATTAMVISGALPPEARAEAAEHARKRMRRMLACDVLDAGCVMIALPAETTHPAGPFGDTTMQLTVPIRPAA